MEYTKLGSTDIKISKICVGCMSFGKAGTMHDWTLDESATEEVVKHALDLGIVGALLQTADLGKQRAALALKTGDLAGGIALSGTRFLNGRIGLNDLA